MKKILIMISLLVLGPNFLASAGLEEGEVGTLVTTTVEATTFGADGKAKRHEKKQHRQIVTGENNKKDDKDLRKLAASAEATKSEAAQPEAKAETLGIFDTATQIVKGLTTGVSSMANGIASTASGFLVGLIPILP